MTPVLSPWSVSKRSQPRKPSLYWASRCHLKSHSKNCSVAACESRNREEELCPLAHWIQKLFGFHALAAVAAVKSTVPRAIPTTVDVVGDNAAEQETPGGQEIFRHVLSKLQNSLRFWSQCFCHCRCLQIYTQECFPFHALLSLSARASNVNANNHFHGH